MTISPGPSRSPVRGLRRFQTAAVRVAGNWTGVNRPVPKAELPWRPGQPSRQGVFTLRRMRRTRHSGSTLPAATVVGGLLIWSLYPTDEVQRYSTAAKKAQQQSRRGDAHSDDGDAKSSDKTAWQTFASGFEGFSKGLDVEWGAISDKIVGLILPDWSKFVPGYVRKLQRELSMAPGSLADEIWNEAHDPLVNPEVRYAAKVRVSSELCDEEKEFLSRRKRIAKVALAKYLDIDEDDVHPDDVPTIAVCGSGGGLRALVAGTASLHATAEDGLFDCVTYTAGVSGSCWAQALYHSTLGEARLDRVLEHLKARIGVHIAYPPAAFPLLTSAPTNKYLLSGIVEKLRGDPKATFGLVDAYGLLLAARLLVPKGELEVTDRDFKLSNQRQYIKYGQNPLPIYTAVRHEIPGIDTSTNKSLPSVPEDKKEIAKREAWFQWFEMTPYELFCEEFAAGIPTWAMGRKFKDGADLPPEDGFHLPEIRMPLLMGIWGSAFCATLSHYYREVRPLMRSLSGFGAVDDMISGRNEDLSKVHPIDPATLPNFAYGMQGKLPKTTPKSIYENEHIQLMDAGMSNNLPIYPLLRPGRDVDVVVAFDASADVKTDNWLSVADGYARQRGIKGWPVGIGWPKYSRSSGRVEQELEDAQASSAQEAESKLTDAKVDQTARRIEAGMEDRGDGVAIDDSTKFSPGDEEIGDLGYCTVWVGTTQEHSSKQRPPSKAVTDSTEWQLMERDAGIAVIYLPFLQNDKVEGVDPGSSDYMSTWNFVYKPDEIDKVVALARANYEEGRAQIKGTIRAVYERKKKMREEKEEGDSRQKYRRLVRLGKADKLEGDQFS